MPLPVPTLDHVVINVRDRMDEAAGVFARLGFSLTPRGYHSLGSMNHLAMFGTEYLELIGARAGDEQRRDILGWAIGLNGLVFGTDDSAATYAALHAAGVPIREPSEFTRPVALAGGSRDAVFRTVRLPHEAVRAGRLYFCHHLTRDLVWRDEWRTHANGAVGVIRALVAADDPDELGALFRKMFGAGSVRAIEGGLRLIVGLSSFDVVAPAVLGGMYGDALPAGAGRPAWMAGLEMRTRDRHAAAAALRAGGIAGVRDLGASVVVPASAAFDTMLIFTE
jgi:hypothetical protein